MAFGLCCYCVLAYHLTKGQLHSGENLNGSTGKLHLGRWVSLGGFVLANHSGVITERKENISHSALFVIG